jgi:ABC-type xylose transport system permease subunit
VDVVAESDAIVLVGVLTAFSGLIVALRMHDATWRRGQIASR